MSSIIDPTTAKDLIKEYQAKNSTAGGPALITPNGEFLQGYFLDRSSIENVFSDPDITGLSLYLAVAPGYSGSGGNIFTVVFVGAVPNPDWVEGSATEKTYLSKGDIYDFNEFCPPRCTDLTM